MFYLPLYPHGFFKEEFFSFFHFLGIPSNCLRIAFESLALLPSYCFLLLFAASWSKKSPVGTFLGDATGLLCCVLGSLFYLGKATCYYRLTLILGLLGLPACSAICWRMLELRQLCCWVNNYSAAFDLGESSSLKAKPLLSLLDTGVVMLSLRVADLSGLLSRLPTGGLADCLCRKLEKEVLLSELHVAV